MNTITIEIFTAAIVSARTASEGDIAAAVGRGVGGCANYDLRSKMTVKAITSQHRDDILKAFSGFIPENRTGVVRELNLI